ncbi:MAG: class I SAM-dependent methyltransferase [Sandaracinus sp.]|nr:class I SAM-dependent methyltransferase [Sandaracinus sp.]MCB9614625.1 class I SAM-dependent methyltransferase [Sandaracinus sp.]MCB9631102.1 class I SAM-dependent methyltransferase [Sandaracinus sp.]
MSHESRDIREAAHATGGRVLEMHAATPKLNAWYYDKLREHVRGDVLELGAGIGNISKLLAADARSLLVTEVEASHLDVLREALEGHGHVEVARYDLEGPPPPEVAPRRFDTVLSMNVLEHVRDDGRAVRDLAGLLRPGGWMLTYVPALPLAYGPMDAALGHHRRYTTKSFAALMRQAGLEVARCEYMNVLGLAGWLVSNKILRRDVPDPSQVGLFEKLVPLVRLEDRVRVPFGLGVICHAKKP